MTSRSENNEKKKRPWTEEEDKVLRAYVEQHGAGNWNVVSENSGLSRCGKSCRFRWVTYLRPDLKQGPITDEEDILITQLHAIYGNTWAKIASQLPGRTDNEIKNFWITKAKRLAKQGLPVYPNGVQVMNVAAQSSRLNTEVYLRPEQIPIPVYTRSTYQSILRDHYSTIDSIMKEICLPLGYTITPEQMLEQFSLPSDNPLVESTPVEQFTQQIPPLCDDKCSPDDPMLDFEELLSPLCHDPFVESTPEQLTDSHMLGSLGAQQSDPMQVPESDNNTLLQVPASSQQSDPMQVLESVNNTLVQVPASSQQSDPMQVPESDNNTLLHVLASDLDQWFESMLASQETIPGDDSCPSYSDVEEWLNESCEDRETTIDVEDG